MVLSRRTLGVLAVPLCALAVTATAQAALAQPASAAGVTLSVADASTGNPLPSDAFTAYTNSPSESFRVTATGIDPSATTATLTPDTGSPVAGTPSSGSATFPVGALPAGTHHLSYDDNSTTAEQTSIAVQVDQIPGIQGATDGTGNVLSDGGTSSGIPTFSAANGIPGEPVELFIDGQLIASETADPAGQAQSLSPTTAPTTGYHTAYVESVDAQGHPSDPSSTVGFYVPPAAPTVTSPTMPSGGGFAFENSDKPNVSVSGVDPGATVNLYETSDANGNQTMQLLNSVTSAGGGTVTIASNTALTDGFQTLAVTQSETEGTGANQKPVASDWMPTQTSVDIDTAKPDLTSSAVAGSVINDNKPSFTGEVPNGGSDNPNAQMKFINAVTGQTLATIPLSQYRWIPSSPLPDGQYSVYAVSVDDTGHLGAAQSDPISFTIDTVAPATPSITGPAAGSAVTTGMPSITVHGDPGTTMYLSIDQGTAAAQYVSGVTADGNGNATFRPTTALSAGQHTLVVDSLDAAGNDSRSSPVTFTVSTAAPTGGSTTPTPAPTPAPTPTPATPRPPAPAPAPAPAEPRSVRLSSHTLSARHPVRVGFTVTKPGAVLVTLTETVKHTHRVKVHGKTRTVTTTLVKAIGHVSVKVKRAGKSSYALSTRFAGRKLGRGSYTLALQTTSGKRRSRAFTARLSVR